MTVYMPFEGGEANALLDYSGNSNDGTKGAGAVWNATAGHDGRGAFLFDGNSEAWINVGNVVLMWRSISSLSTMHALPLQ